MPTRADEAARFPLVCGPESHGLLKLLVKRLADEIANELDVAIVINGVELIEAFECAAQTLCFYGENKPKETVSFYKEAGHVVFWINKLKPCRIETVPDRIGATRRLGVASLISDVIGKLSHIEAGAPEDIGSKLNETIALRVGIELIEMSQDKIMSELKYPAHRVDFEAQRNVLQGRFESLLPDLVSSLRYHNHSARSMGLLLETLTLTSHC